VTTKSDFPKVVDFQGTLPAPEVYRPKPERIVAGDPVQGAQTLFKSADGRLTAASGRPSAERGASSSPKASSATSSKA